MYKRLTRRVYINKKIFIFVIAVYIFSFLLLQAKNLVLFQSFSRLGEAPTTNDIINLSEFNKSPVIFIGGYARSGTTLMRAILDVHPMVSCGPETKILPIFLKSMVKYHTNKRSLYELERAHLNISTVDSATALFVYYILKNHIANTERLCAKDPEILYHIEYLHGLFPNAKFIYMVRDGRDVVYSLMTQLKEDFTQNKIKSYLTTWSYYNNEVFKQCTKVGKRYCKIVKYEDLVNKTENVLRDVVKFLDISWSDELLNHEKYVGNKVVISDSEWSSNQIKQPINSNSVNKWVGKLRYDTRFTTFIKILSRFNYTTRV